MKLLDLFSGIGGFSYGLERIGFKTVAFCEMDKYCKLILQKHWKGVNIYNDVKEITKERLEADGVELPEIITGGFPCQPFSIAGARKGTSDDRYLWPEMFRIIKELKPRWVIGENVRGITNIQDGMVFETVCTDLEGEGYEVRAFNIPAAGVGAPHRRERIWIVANARRSIRREQSSRNTESIGSRTSQETERSSDTNKISGPSEGTKIMANTNSRLSDRENEEVQSGGQTFDTSSQRTDVANTTSKGLERQFGSKLQGTRERFTHGSQTINGDVANTERKRLEGLSEQSSTIGKQDERLLSRNESSRGQTKRTDVANADGERQQKQWGSKSIQEKVSRQTTGTRSECESGWSVEPDVGRVAHGISGRVHRLKALGNSIVPKIAEEIGKAIMKAEADDVRYQGGGAYKAMLKLFRDNLR